MARDVWLRHVADQRAFDRELAKILADAAREAERIVARSLGNESASAVIRRAQASSSAHALRQIQADLWGSTTQATMNGIRRSVALSQKYLGDLSDLLGRNIVDADLRRQFDAAARNAVENLRSRYVNRIDLADSVYRNEALANGKVAQVVNRGILLNKSAAEIAKDVRQYIDPNVKGGVSYAAKRLGRTELNNAFHETTLRGVREVPWTEGVKWNLSGSHPRTDICNDYADADGYNMGSGVYPPSVAPGKPHPQCLCYLSVIQMNQDAFIERLTSGGFDQFLADQGIL